MLKKELLIYLFVQKLAIIGLKMHENLQNVIFSDPNMMIRKGSSTENVESFR